VKKFAVSALAIAALAGSAFGQEPVRLELRIIPQTGVLPATVSDLPQTTAGSPINFTAVGQAQRYELQYRVLDLDPSDGNNIPAGLSAASINITVSSAVAGTIGRAQISRAENGQIAGNDRPQNPDTTGLPTPAAASGRQGLHAPFRGGLFD